MSRSVLWWGGAREIVADRVSRSTRSRIMSRIRGTDTGPERLVRNFLHRAGLRFRLHRRDLPGKPDIVLPKHGSIVLVNGCFWHRHKGCDYAYFPKSNGKFWRKKFAANVSRDRRIARLLRIMGWRIFVVWECRMAAADLSRLIRRITRRSERVRLRAPG